MLRVPYHIAYIDSRTCVVRTSRTMLAISSSTLEERKAEGTTVL